MCNKRLITRILQFTAMLWELIIQFMQWKAMVEEFGGILVLIKLLWLRKGYMCFDFELWRKEI